MPDPTPIRRQAADRLGLPPSRVTVVWDRTPGGWRPTVYTEDERREWHRVEEDQWTSPTDRS